MNEKLIIMIENGRLQRYLYSKDYGIIDFIHEKVIFENPNRSPIVLYNITGLNISGCKFNNITTNDTTKMIIYQQGGEI